MHYASYLAAEEESQVRHEYLAGEVRAVDAATPDHSALAASVLRIIAQQLPQGWRAYTSNLRVRIPATDLSTYPDGTVVCGGSQRANDDPIAVTDPTILVEVTSNSTEIYDRGEKLRNYQTIPSLREILIVSHKAPRISLHRREENGWTPVDAVSRRVAQARVRSAAPSQSTTSIGTASRTNPSPRTPATRSSIR